MLVWSCLPVVLSDVDVGMQVKDSFPGLEAAGVKVGAKEVRAAVAVSVLLLSTCSSGI